MTWADIAKAAQEAKGPDWRLDEAVLRLCGGQVRRVTKLGLNGRTKGGERYWPAGSTSVKGYPVPKPSGSVDAVLALIADLLPGWRWVAHSPRGGLGFGASLSDPATGGWVVVAEKGVASAALALLTALAKAMAARDG